MQRVQAQRFGAEEAACVVNGWEAGEGYVKVVVVVGERVVVTFHEDISRILREEDSGEDVCDNGDLELNG